MDSTILIIVILGVLGTFNTLYLSSHVFTKKPVKCIFFPPEWCAKVQYSKYSRTLGIPNAFAGLGMYLAILALAFFYNAGTIPFWPLIAIISFGFAFSLYFTLIQGFVLKAFCTWCVVSAIEFFLLFCTMLVHALYYA